MARCGCLSLPSRAPADRGRHQAGRCPDPDPGLPPGWADGAAAHRGPAAEHQPALISGHGMRRAICEVPVQDLSQRLKQLALRSPAQPRSLDGSPTSRVGTDAVRGRIGPRRRAHKTEHQTDDVADDPPGARSHIPCPLFILAVAISAIRPDDVSNIAEVADLVDGADRQALLPAAGNLAQLTGQGRYQEAGRLPRADVVEGSARPPDGPPLRRPAAKAPSRRQAWPHRRSRSAQWTAVSSCGSAEDPYT